MAGGGSMRQNMFMILAIIGVSLYSYILSVIDVETLQSSSKSVAITSQNHSSLRKSSIHQVQPRECTIYVAPSSLKGNPGYGIFTIRDLWKNEPVLGGPDGVSIPIQSYDVDRNAPNAKAKRQWVNLFNPYWWGRGVPDHVQFDAGSDYVDFQIGFGYLPNHHCVLQSLNPQYPEPPYDDNMVNRFSSPGAGAFSYNIGREFTVTRDVKSGEELFMSYGYCKHGRGPGWTNDIYMPSEFNQASDIIWERIAPDASKSFRFDNGRIDLSDVDIPDNEAVHAQLVKELLPANAQEVKAVLAAPLTRDSLPKYLAQTKGIIPRTPEWIKENGMCLETIKAQKSTLPDAGQGAFVQHVVKKGERVAIAPLLHIMDRKALDLYDPTGEKKIGTQLLMNYCFENPHSTVLLCPTTNAVVINHCSDRKKQCGSRGPNADYRWSTGWDKTSDEWRQESLEELAEKGARGLSFEIYALRDIQPGEEVFIDYGAAWEKAWEEHVQSWKPPPKPKQNWISAKEANSQGGPILPDLMLKKDNVYDTVEHPYLMTGCVYWTDKNDDDDVYHKKTNWKNMEVEDVLENYSDDGGEFVYSRGGYSNHWDGLHWPCSVLWRDDNRDYVVRIHQSPTQDEAPWHTNGLPRILTSYPRESIHYFVKPYAADQHLPGVFRHPIVMRDDIFPPQWKNLS